MFKFFKKKQPKESPSNLPGVTITTTREDSEHEVKMQVLQHMVIEQRLMIRQLHEVCTMLSEHQKYESIRAKLDRIKNTLDKIK